MIDIELLKDRIIRSIGLIDVLHELLYSLQIRQHIKKEFNSVLALADCLQVELNSAYELVINEV